jgi:hypothetical protein
MKLSLSMMGCLAVGLFAGCTKPTMAGAGVHVAKARSDVNGCQPISAVESTEGSEERAETDLRNRAGRMNANWVLINDKVENGGYVNLKGTAYTCPKDMGIPTGDSSDSASDGSNDGT